jgi:hypothetical protein
MAVIRQRERLHRANEQPRPDPTGHILMVVDHDFTLKEFGLS